MGDRTAILPLVAYNDNKGVSQIRISEDYTLSTSPWQPYSTSVEWALTGDVAYAQFRDRASNTSVVYGTDDIVHGYQRYLPLIGRSDTKQ